ncbi:MAG: TniQ family protein [Methylotenera sp.]|nr:TniQ family protein [Methylotenera sp.]
MTCSCEHHVLEQSIQPLVITPSPYKGESLPGFILRAAEDNGYESPLKLLHYAGMDDNEARSARPSLDKLAPLFGKSIEDFKATGLDSGSESRGRYVQIMGHSIPSMFTSCKHASLCVECVKENGFIDGYHEIKYALACPKHKIKTLNSCPVCHKTLSWHRLGLTKCKCGAGLAQFNPEKIDIPEVLALLGVLYSKLMNQSLNHQQIDQVGFPSEAMEHISVQTLLSVIYRFGLFNSKLADSADVDMAAVETTAKVFSNWPHNFYDYLEENQAPGANFKVSGLRGQFNSFYESFFKNIARDQELQFMRDAFISFGQERWKLAAIHPSFMTNETARVLGINALSKKINKHPRTIKKLINEGLIKVLPSCEGQTRNLFDLADQEQIELV